MKISFFGTAMLLLDDGRDQLLFDCHVSRPSLGRCFWGRLSTDRAVADRVIRDFGMGRLRGIFISHSHYDHVLDAPYFAIKCGADIFGSPSALNVARGGGVPEGRLHACGEGREFVLGDFRVRALPSLHSPARWYNNDLGKTIDAPLAQPAKRRAYREGGSFDFLINHAGRSFLIRPSCNYLPGQLAGVRAEVLFLGVGGLAGFGEAWRRAFFGETIDRVQPRLVVPIHWDNFFSPLYGPRTPLPRFIQDSGRALNLLRGYCGERGINCVVQQPLDSMEL